MINSYQIIIICSFGVIIGGCFIIWVFERVFEKKCCNTNKNNDTHKCLLNLEELTPPTITCQAV
jgi:hypothetical protein